jgi:hypothetical protein
MASTVYRIQVVQIDRQDWFDALRKALIAELRAVGVHHSVDLQIGADSIGAEPGLVVYLGSDAAVADTSCIAALDQAVSELRTVIPVVDDLRRYRQLVPRALEHINGWQWTGGDEDTTLRLARFLLEDLGIEERQRSVFISHKRDDGLLAAEQLRDHLSKHGFEPFIDRFDIRSGEDVQSTIADALECYAFILLLETPLAHTSEWVYDEVDYALSHGMGIHIVRWPGDPTPIPGSDRLRRQELTLDDLVPLKGYDVLADAALDRTLSEVEAAHAFALVRRRRNLLRSIEEAAEAKGLTSTPLPGWRLIIDTGQKREIVGVCPRLPEVVDLRGIDAARESSSATPERALVVHAARILRSDRRSLLTWAAGDRPIALLPENAIGARW